MWLDIGPLGEGQYTGISQVTAALAGEMLADRARAVGFFYEGAVVEPTIVGSVLAQQEGALLPFHLARAEPRAPASAADETAAVIFPNRKTCRGCFPIETQIVHDLSTLLTPQFHDADAVAFHATSLREDILGNHLTFCVSDATRQDVLRYLGPPDPGRVLTIHPGCDLAPDPASDPALGVAEPFALVLGTIEPRKNIAQILEFLASQPHVLGALRFVFLGRHGWGDAPHDLLERYGLGAAAAAGRILFAGYVGPQARDALLARARVMIYPSLFEGFGLPVLEALAAGTPCLTTRSSSLPEAGGTVATYFDPFLEGDFGRGFAAALQDDPRARAARKAHAAGFTWRRFWDRIAGAIERIAAEMEDDAGRD